MEWTKCRTTKLIELFEQESVLWNVRSAHHKNSNSRVDALQRISEALGSKSDEIEKKLHNIRSQYLREKTKIEKSKKSGAGASDVYVPNISNILYQAECGGAGVNMFPPWNNSQNTFYRAQPPQTFPGYNQHNYASSSSPSPYPSPQANNQQPQLSPVELQTNQTPVEDYEVLQNSFYQ
ncbi:hypothetical protein WA026_016264 [Henosepilachna vigintioctopunctata]|uniref:MADF domain-containing protein n=1 Tax=Henosepilachna vigintioctopunctata TaxID=420089 RepID=A0AAW1ULJ8_9CUCU